MRTTNGNKSFMQFQTYRKIRLFMQCSISKKRMWWETCQYYPLKWNDAELHPPIPRYTFAWGLEVGETHWKEVRSCHFWKWKSRAYLFRKHELRMNMELWTYKIWERILHYAYKNKIWTMPTYSPHIHLCPKFTNRIIYLKTLELEVSRPRSQSFFEVMANFQPPTSKKNNEKHGMLPCTALFAGSNPHGWKFGFATHIWRQPTQLGVSRSYLSIKDHYSTYCP